MTFEKSDIALIRLAFDFKDELKEENPAQCAGHCSLQGHMLCKTA